MLKSTIAAAALALACATAAAQTPGRYETLADALWGAVNEHYYDPHFRGADWPVIRERYRVRAARVRNDAEFAALANTMMAEIPSSHLYVSPPAQSSADESGIAVRFAEIGGETIITEAAALSDARRKGLRAGDRLLSPRASLRGPLGSLALLQVQGCDGRRRSVSVRRERAFFPPEHPGFRWSQLNAGPGGRIGYLRIDRFDDGAAALADSAMAELGDTRGLIIDVRGNSGGNVSALRLASHFGAGAEQAVTLFARPYLEALGHVVTPADVSAAPRVNGAYTDGAVFTAVTSHNGGAAFWTDAVANRYAHPVALLIGEETGSAAEGFAWYMRLRTPAHLIGRRTSGELLSAETIPFGDGWTVTVPVHGLWGPNGEDLADRAVTPNEEIVSRREDLCVGRDPDLAAALDWLAQQ